MSQPSPLTRKEFSWKKLKQEEQWSSKKDCSFLEAKIASIPSLQWRKKWEVAVGAEVPQLHVDLWISVPNIIHKHFLLCTWSFYYEHWNNPEYL
jgi:hypothetical protein